ncbi:MAG TPA: ABC transporter permease [Puia sp.]|nr:ABC transporter permease [Puia sp.]
MRSLRRNQSYTLINFSGLTVGMVACLLLFLLVRYETSFDTFHSKRDRIYRVISVNHDPKGDWRNAAAPFPLAEALKSGFPQIEEVAPTYLDWGVKVTIDQGKGGEPKILKENPLYVAPSFFKVFDFGSLEGDPNVLLDAPYTVMLTKSTAERYFGDWRSAVGKTLTLYHNVLVKVAGILKDPPPNTDFPFTIVVSHSTLTAAKIKNLSPNDWVNLSSAVNCYIVLRTGVSATSEEQQIDRMVRSHRSEEAKNNGVGLQALAQMHYDGKLDVYSGKTFSLSLVRALVWIGVFLLVIACINFINLATAQAINRAREVGVRKVLGSGRRELILRFLGETGILSGLALASSILLAIPLLGPVNVLLGAQLTSAPLASADVIVFLLGLWVAVTILAGVYPSFVLSGFNPVAALKSKTAASSTRGLSLRRALVVLQFVVAQVLITGVLVIVSQMNYFRHADLGFVKNAIINVPIPGDSLSRSRYAGLRDELMKNPGVEGFSYSFTAPTDNSGTWSDFRYDHQAAKTPFGAALKFADTGYFSLYHLQLVAGRIYSNTYTSDTTREFVINETCAKRLGLHRPDEALGHEINFWDRAHVGRIVGVVKDFNVQSLKDSISPVVMWPWPLIYQTANIKLQPTRIKEALAAVQKAWTGAFPNSYFEYQFVEDKLAALYSQEEQLGTLYEVFAGIAIFISCLGLYGLISFMAVQRNKEIGIRKVLGASVSQVVALLSREFTLLVLTAFVVATPVSWYFMQRWLENYVYRIVLGPRFFVLTAVAAVVIAWMAVGYRAVRAAIANPAGALRAE